MPILEWQETYSVGVSRIDEEHKKLIAMINKAYDTSENGQDDEAMSELITDMIDYATTHFATEAELMREHGYPDSQAHLLEHGDFTARVVTTGSMKPSEDWHLDPVKIFKYLASWLNNHMMVNDMKLGKFLNEKGVF